MPKTPDSAARLFPSQVCFVVDDVPGTAAECSRRFGWGPFETFTASVEDAEHKGSLGRRVTDVALGMAGAVQVELVHVHQGSDCIATYQARYGQGFQHLGIDCRSRDAALARLEELGAAVDNLNEYTGIRIAFVDVPTGPGMFELLQPTSEDAGPTGEEVPHDPTTPLLAVDRATIVTDDLEKALAFYSHAFGWEGVTAETCSLRSGQDEARLRRARARAGLLELELIEGLPAGRDPYSAHLGRGDHGLVHAGVAVASPDDSARRYEWLESGESFDLEDWGGGTRALQVRSA